MVPRPPRYTRTDTLVPYTTLFRSALVTEKREAVGMRTSSGAHDFSNLLAATSAGVYLLRKRGPEEALLSGIEEAVERGKALTHSLLSFAKDHEREKRL